MEDIMGTPVFSVNRNSGLMLRDNIGMSIGARIKQARAAAKMSQIELATRSGLKQSTISDLEVGKSQGTTAVASLAAALGVSPLWLETGKGSMTATEPAKAQPATSEDDPFVKSTVSLRIGDEPKTVPIRKVKLKLRAGVAGYVTEPVLEDGGVLHMPLALIEENNLTPHHLLAFHVRGCSMEPMFFEDDLVVIDTSDTLPRDREIYALNFDGEACVKQLLKSGGQWYLNSLNPDYGKINIRSGQCEIVGRVMYQHGRMVTSRL